MDDEPTRTGFVFSSVNGGKSEHSNILNGNKILLHIFSCDFKNILRSNTHAEDNILVTNLPALGFINRI